MYGGAAVPGEPEGLGVERAGSALGDGIELNAECQLKMTGRMWPDIGPAGAWPR